MTGVGCKDLVGCHLCDRGAQTGVHQINYLVSKEDVHQRNDDEPYEERTAADDESIFEANDITQTEHCSTYVKFKHHFCLVSYGLAKRKHS